jgi:hypothetical protein
VSPPEAVRCGDMHVCPSSSAQVAARCPPSPSPSVRTAGSALVVHSVLAHTPAAVHSPLVHTPAARTLAVRMAVACWSRSAVADRELAGEGNNRLLAVAKLVRMAKALLVDATRTVYVLSEVVHLLVCRKVRHSERQSAS